MDIGLTSGGRLTAGLRRTTILLHTALSPKGCLGQGLLGLAVLAVLFLYFNWGIWRSKVYELMGVEMSLKTVYETDISGRGREAGFHVAVYQLPDDVDARLNENGIDLSEYPVFVAHYERDGFTRITWARGFPRNDVERQLFRYFEWDVSGDPMPTLDGILDDSAAQRMASHLLHLPETVCGGWYKDCGVDSTGEMWIPDFYFFVMNVEKRTLIMFGLHT